MIKYVVKNRIQCSGQRPDVFNHFYAVEKAVISIFLTLKFPFTMIMHIKIILLNSICSLKISSPNECVAKRETLSLTQLSNYIESNFIFCVYIQIYLFFFCSHIGNN